MIQSTIPLYCGPRPCVTTPVSGRSWPITWPYASSLITEPPSKQSPRLHCALLCMDPWQFHKKFERLYKTLSLPSNCSATAEEYNVPLKKTGVFASSAHSCVCVLPVQQTCPQDDGWECRLPAKMGVLFYSTMQRMAQGADSAPVKFN